MAVTEATEKLRAAIREYLEEHPLATAKETLKALQDAGVEVGSTSSFEGYHVPAVRKDLGIDARKIQARAAVVREAARRKANGAAEKSTRQNMTENITGPENLNGVVKKPAPESDDDFDAAANAREIFYGTGRPDLAEAARRLLEQVEEECLGSYGGWVSWYGQGPDEVLRVLRLRVALGMEIPEDFAPLLALGREAA